MADRRGAREDREREIERLRRENERLRRELERVREERDRLERERDRLRDGLETARRAAKRQAAPFSKGAPTPHPRRPGRKPGPAYGRRAWRPVPEHVDEVLDVLPPEACPACGGAVGSERVDVQYQADLPPVRPHVTAFHVHVGRCRQCGRRVQGRDGRQTSTAGGAAASQLGPRAVAWAAWLHTGLGVPFAKVAAIFGTGFGLTVTPGGLAQALHRVAVRATPTYHALVLAVRRSAVVAPDETGWKVAGWACPERADTSEVGVSPRGGPSGTAGEKFPFVGWTNTAAPDPDLKDNAVIVAFTVRWGKYGSVTAWTGTCRTQNGSPTIAAVWHLGRANSKQAWDHIVTSQDVFTPGPPAP